MKHTIIYLLFFFATSLLAQSKISKHDILARMQTANNYFMAKWPDPGANIVTNKTRPSNLWTRGVYYEGLMAYYYITKDSVFYKYAVDWGTKNQWKPTYVTLPILITDNQSRIADNHCCGQTYIELYNIDKKPERVANIKTCIDFMVKSTKSNDWWWIDALQMAMPVFAKMGVLYNDTNYFAKMYNLYSYTKYKAKGVGLYNTTDHLWYRDSVYLPPKKSPNGLPVYWSRGNGWVFAALARTLDVLPKTDSHRSDYLTTFKEMAAKLITIQRTDGFWNPNLGDADDYGGKESSGTAFFTYGLAWGIRNGSLDSATFYPAMAKGWNGLISEALHTDGFIGWVQGAGSKPADAQPLSYDKAPDFEDFCLGAFLLAGSEIYHLLNETRIVSSIEPKKSENYTLDVYPNPFSNNININYSIEKRGYIDIAIYSLTGEHIVTLIKNNNIAAGNFHIQLNSNSACFSKMKNGVFFVKMMSGNNLIVKKIVNM